MSVMLWQEEHTRWQWLLVSCLLYTSILKPQSPFFHPVSYCIYNTAVYTAARKLRATAKNDRRLSECSYNTIIADRRILSIQIMGHFPQKALSLKPTASLKILSFKPIASLNAFRRTFCKSAAQFKYRAALLF